MATEDKKEFSDDVSIDDIALYFRQHNSGPFFSLFETGLDNYRFDLIRIIPIKSFVRIYEFKSCRADFLSDKKWQNYLDYCHTFTFVSPKYEVRRQDLPRGIGLMWIYKWKWKTSLFENNWLLKSEWVQRPKKREVDKDILIRLAFSLVHRCRWRKEDVF